MKKNIMTMVAAMVVAFPLCAEDFILSWESGGSPVSVTIDISDYPAEVVQLIKDNQAQIEAALEANNVTQTQVEDAIGTVKTAYDDLLTDSSLKTTAPYTTAKNGLNDFADVLVDVLPNTQIIQNAWGNAWIGSIWPKPVFGFGLNVGAAKLDIANLKDTADALGIDVDGIGDTLAFPTITADVRAGGYILPFDVGFTVSSINSEKIGAIDSLINPVTFHFFTIGADVRYLVFNGKAYTGKPKVSVGLGGYYTKGGLAISDDSAEASLDFDTTTLFLSAQASAKWSVFVPFVGTKILLNKTNVDWDIDANWEKILTGAGVTATDIVNAASWGILPTHFSGGSSSSFGNHIRPVISTGVSIDVAVIDITLQVSYDIVSQIPAGSLSFRLVWNQSKK